jgi:hypothetical protein
LTARYQAAAHQLVSDFREHSAVRLAAARQIRRALRCGVPTPFDLVHRLNRDCVEFGWTSWPFQDLFMPLLCSDPAAAPFPPDPNRAAAFFKALADEVEFSGHELHELLVQATTKGAAHLRFDAEAGGRVL